MARSLNKVQLIGNLTRDPELRYTPQGTAVCTFSLATNRQWKTESGDTKDDAEFHRVVAWNQLAEICSKMLKKGTRTYIEGRLQTRSWQGQDGAQRQTTEIVASDMILLDGRRTEEISVPDDFDQTFEESQEATKKPEKAAKGGKKESQEKTSEEEEDIPF